MKKKICLVPRHPPNDEAARVFLTLTRENDHAWYGYPAESFIAKPITGGEESAYLKEVWQEVLL